MWIQVNPIHHNGSQTEEGGGGWGVDYDLWSEMKK